MVYQCGMYRNFADTVSTEQLKVGDSINWLFGYKFYKSRGTFNFSRPGSGI